MKLITQLYAKEKKMGDTDKQYSGQLIDEYYMLVNLRKLAVKENADEVVNAIDEQMRRIKLKLQPVELPD